MGRQKHPTEEAFLRALLDHAPVAIAVVQGMELRYILANQAYQSIAGPDARIVGRTYREVFPDAAARGAEERLKEVLRTGEPWRMRDFGTPLPGREGMTWWDGEILPLPDPSGHAQSLLMVVWDTTTRRQDEEALRRSEERAQRNLAELRAVLETMSEGLVIVDHEGNILMSNPAMARLAGWEDSPREGVPEYARRIEVYDRSGQPVPQEQWPLFRALRGEYVQNVELRIHRKEAGRDYVGLFSAGPVYSPDGRLRMAVITVRDVTLRKEAEEALKRSKEELESRVHERTAELETRNRELQDFAFIASHDLKEPLRKIQAFANLIEARSQELLDPETLDYLARLRNAAGRMQLLLDSLLEYSRVAINAKPFAKISLSSAIHEALSNLEILVQETDAFIEIGDLSSTIEADDSQLIELFQNLFANALKFRRQGERPRLRIYSRTLEDEITGGGEYEIYVEDNGIGFDEKYAEKAFMPFQRLHGRSEYEGVGMGLAICKKIVERHKGAIMVRSTPGKGSTFVVRLPAKHDQMQAQKDDEEQSILDQGQVPDRSGPRESEDRMS